MTVPCAKLAGAGTTSAVPWTSWPWSASGGAVTILPFQRAKGAAGGSGSVGSAGLVAPADSPSTWRTTSPDTKRSPHTFRSRVRFFGGNVIVGLFVRDERGSRASGRGSRGG